MSMLGQLMNGTALPEQWIGSAMVVLCLVGYVAYRLRGGRML